MLRLSCGLLTAGVLLCFGCTSHPDLNASLDPAALEGKHKSWFEEHWGQPNGKTPRFFGRESWTYFRITGGDTIHPVFTGTPHECQIVLDFDQDGHLDDYEYSGC